MLKSKLSVLKKLRIIKIEENIEEFEYIQLVTLYSPSSSSHFNFIHSSKVESEKVQKKRGNREKISIDFRKKAIN